MSSIRRFMKDRSQRWLVSQGDVLRLLLRLPNESIASVIGDSPYCSGGMFRADRAQKPSVKYVMTQVKLDRPEFEGDSRDQISYQYWTALWLCEAYRATEQGGVCGLFTDWRQLAPTILALQAGGFVYRGCVPWDKTRAVRPQKGRFRAQAEFFVWGSKGEMPEERGVGCLDGVVRGPSRAEGKWHIAGKNIRDVMRPLVRITRPGGTILDPFAGGASTGVAALLEGNDKPEEARYRFIGFEIAPVHAENSRRRLHAAERGIVLPSPFSAREEHEDEAGEEAMAPIGALLGGAIGRGVAAQ